MISAQYLLAIYHPDCLLLRRNDYIVQNQGPFHSSDVGAMTTLELGGNIALSGFSERDFTELIVVKKMVGQYARRFTDSMPGFSRLAVTLKEVHGTKFEVIVKAGIDGHEFASEVTEHNLFVALDSALKHVQSQMERHTEKMK